MFTECTQLFRIIKNVESVRSPHMFLLSTLYPTFYCGSGWAKARLFLFFLRSSRAIGGIQYPLSTKSDSAETEF